MQKVSIIIPSYGGNTDLCRAIDSVLTQDYENLEVIVVDDNGNGTQQQLKNQCSMEKYCNDIRVKYIIHDVNRGGSAARNTGASNSDGEYIGFLDDDDEFCQSKISIQMKAAEKLDETWAGTYSSVRIFKGKQYVRTVIAQKNGNIAKEYIADKIKVGTPAAVIRRSVFDSIGGFDESFKRHQDWEFFSRIFDQYKIMSVPEAFFNRYYKTDTKRRSARERLEYMDHYAAKMKETIKGIPSKSLDRLLRRKYIAIVCSLLREKDFKTAHKIMKEKRYGLTGYIMIGWNVLDYIRNRLKYGTHF